MFSKFYYGISVPGDGLLLKAYSLVYNFLKKLKFLLSLVNNTTSPVLQVPVFNQTDSTASSVAPQTYNATENQSYNATAYQAHNVTVPQIYNVTEPGSVPQAYPVPTGDVMTPTEPVSNSTVSQVATPTYSG